MPIPLLHQLRSASAQDLSADARAGFQVAMLDIPQGMAYAAVAGLPLHSGTMCSAVAATVGSCLGPSRWLMLGPTNGTALLTFSFFAAHPQLDQRSLMPLLVACVGGLLLVAAVTRIAGLTRHVSRAALVGYVGGAALLIIARQAFPLLGIIRGTAPAALPFAAGTLPDETWHLLDGLHATDWRSVAVGLGTIAVWLLFLRLRPSWPGLALALVIMSVVVAVLNRWDCHLPTHESAVTSLADLLPPRPDPLAPTLAADLATLAPGAVAIACLALLETASMARLYADHEASRAGPQVAALGTANVACAFLAGMPCSGSLTRTALNHQSGARTSAAALCNGICCAIAAVALGRFVGYLPRAALASMIIVVAVQLLRGPALRRCLAGPRRDTAVCLATFAATCLLPLHQAVLLAALASLVTGRATACTS